jgi:hypothetical protein
VRELARQFDWARYHPLGYECSTAGDHRFSALNARLGDGRTLEEAYQLDIKGYRIRGNDWRLGKGKPPLDRSTNLWREYLALWRQWARENPGLMAELRRLAGNAILTDQFASTPISQARALADILNEQPEAPADPRVRSGQPAVAESD